jgi:hypothetical protein
MKTSLPLFISAFGLAMFTTLVHGEDYTYTTNSGTITITKYTGSGGAVTIPGEVNGLPVTSIGNWAFGYSGPTSVTIPESVTSIEADAFYGCSHLTNATFPQNLVSIGATAFGGCGLSTVSIPSNVTNLGTAVFMLCDRLTGIAMDALNPSYSSVEGVLFNKSQTTILEYPGGKTGSYQVPETVMSIGERAFIYCTNLTSVTIPDSVTSIGGYAFFYCTRMTGVYFQGNAPVLGLDVFVFSNQTTVYHLPGTEGWYAPFGGRGTALWVLPYPVILNISPNFGVKTNQFGFVISWATNVPVVVEASASLTDPTWSAVSTNTLVDGSFCFIDTGWTNYPSRFYRVRSP